MKTKLSLDLLKKIMMDCPIESDNDLFNKTVALFMEEVLSINKDFKEPHREKNNNISEEESGEADYWKELNRYYFYNLIRKYSFGQVDPSEAKEILENCIVKKYISNPKTKNKIVKFIDDTHITKKFTSDLFYSTRSFLIKRQKTETVSLEIQDEDGEWIRKIDPSEDTEDFTIDNIDYLDNDLSEMLSKMSIKSIVLSRYLFWKFKRIRNIRMDFRNDYIELPMKFYLNNNIIARYCSWHKTAKA